MDTTELGTCLGSSPDGLHVLLVCVAGLDVIAELVDEGGGLICAHDEGLETVWQIC